MPQTHVGLDVHKKETQVCITNQDGDILKETRVPTTQEDLQDALPTDEDADVAMEALGFHRPVTDWLEEAGHTVHLAHPPDLPKDPVKTDEKDAEHLAHLLRSDLLPAAWNAPPDIRRLRDLARHRHDLGQRLGDLKARLRQELYKHGHLVDTNPAHTQDGRAWVRDLDIPEVTSILRVLETVEAEKDEAEARIQDHVDGDPPCPMCRRMKTVPGIGDALALTIHAEIGTFDRFPHKDAVPSYAGLTPSRHQSGDQDRRGSITKNGRHLLRWALVQAARSHVRYCSESTLAQRYDRLKERIGSKKAVVATARVLATVLYCMVTREEDFKVNP